MLVPLVVSVLSVNSSTTDQAALFWNSSQLPENTSTSILPNEPTMTVTRVTVNSSLNLQPTTLTPVLTTTTSPVLDIFLTSTTLGPLVKTVPDTDISNMTPGSHSSESDQSSVKQDGSAQIKPKSLDSQLWSDHDFVTLLDAALASFAAIQPAWIPILVTLLTGKCFISVTMHFHHRILGHDLAI
jgi:hypothetical protein